MAKNRSHKDIIFDSRLRNLYKLFISLSIVSYNMQETINIESIWINMVIFLIMSLTIVTTGKNAKQVKNESLANL